MTPELPDAQPAAIALSPSAAQVDRNEEEERVASPTAHLWSEGNVKSSPTYAGHPANSRTLGKTAANRARPTSSDLDIRPRQRQRGDMDEHRWRRRDVLGWAAAAAAGQVIARDAWAGRRPGLMAVMSGDPAPGRAMVWSATDRPARLWVDWSTDPSLKNARRIKGPIATPKSGLTARVDLTGLPAGDVFYRVRFDDGRLSRPAMGRLWTPPSTARPIRIGWGGDVAGQGFGIDLDRRGMRMFEVLRQRRFDLFVHSGDHVYADNPLSATQALDDGTSWSNLVTAAKAKVAETLDEFRGQYAYNMLDPNYRAFFAETPVIAQWDDHEVRNNWYPTQLLDDVRYQEKSVKVLAARARRAFREFMPLRGDSIFRHLPQGPMLDVFVLDARSFRGPNSPNRQKTPSTGTHLFGPTQLDPLKKALKRSTGTWKLIASDVPLGLVIRDGPEHHEGLANGEGPPLGREHELAGLLRFIKTERIRNVVFVTADVHYAAAHLYRPDRAVFTDFEPFWEFVAGPLHAGTFGPNALDPTFGPEVAFSSVPKAMKPNRPPSEGLQFFGQVEIDAQTQQMQVSLHNLSGRTLYTKTLDPVRG